jgi:hypothetical protein
MKSELDAVARGSGQRTSSKYLAGIALTCGVLGALTAVWTYWIVVPGLILGIAAVVLGWRARRNGGSEMGSAALALGIVAILLVPSVIAIADDAEKWGRDCALHPTSDPNC